MKRMAWYFAIIAAHLALSTVTRAETVADFYRGKTVRVVIGKRGKVTSASVVSEAPSGQGFGSAARTCMLEQVFSPGLDRAGQPAATSLNVNVKFSR